MKATKAIMKYIKSPKKLIRTLGAYGVFNWLSDKYYLKLVFWGETGNKLDLNSPITYNEKIQWLKLFDRKPEYITYVDKYAVREYIKKTIGEQYLIPLIGLYESVQEIKWDALPNKFVMKCTHGSGSNIICSDKEELNIDDSVKKLNKWMKKSWYWFGREWPYKNVKPRIICEQYLANNITDYKFMCFNGEPKLIQVHCNRNKENHSIDFYDITWKKTEIRRIKSTNDELIAPPQNLNKMIEIAKLLSVNEIHVRVDLYEVSGKIYFGEKTFYSASGYSSFAKEEYDKLLGSWIRLPIDEQI